MKYCILLEHNRNLLFKICRSIGILLLVILFFPSISISQCGPGSCEVCEVSATITSVSGGDIVNGSVVISGNIEAGDYLATSTRGGYSQLQGDDILHNYTVAKASQDVDWSQETVDSEKGFKWKTIACTYHAA